MKKNIIKSLFLLSVAIFASCNNDFSVDTPKIAAVEPVNIVAVQKPQDNCSFLNKKADFEISLVTATDVTIYYKIQSSADPAPTSDELLASKNKVAMMANKEFIITENDLPLEVSYAFYAISVNVDGLRSEEVYKQMYTTIFQSHEVANIITEIESDFSNAIANNSFMTTPEYKNTTYKSKAPLVTKVAADTYAFDTIWGDFYNTATNGNTTRPYPASVKINPDFSAVVIYDAVLCPYARPSTGTYDPCTKTLSLEINWGSPTNPAVSNPPVYVVTQLTL